MSEHYKREASQWVIFGLPSVSNSVFIKYSNIEARVSLEQMLLRSEMISHHFLAFQLFVYFKLIVYFSPSLQIWTHLYITKIWVWKISEFDHVSCLLILSWLFSFWQVYWAKFLIKEHNLSSWVYKAIALLLFRFPFLNLTWLGDFLGSFTYGAKNEYVSYAFGIFDPLPLGIYVIY